MALVEEPVRGRIPFIYGISDQFIRLRLEADNLNDLFDSPGQIGSNTDLRLNDHISERCEQNPWAVDGRILKSVDH